MVGWCARVVSDWVQYLVVADETCRECISGDVMGSFSDIHVHCQLDRRNGSSHPQHSQTQETSRLSMTPLLNTA